MRKLNSVYGIKDKKKILIFKLAMSNGKFVYTDEKGVDDIESHSKASLVMVKEFRRRTDVYATFQGNFLVNPHHVCYAVPVIVYETLEKDLEDLWG